WVGRELTFSLRAERRLREVGVEGFVPRASENPLVVRVATPAGEAAEHVREGFFRVVAPLALEAGETAAISVTCPEPAAAAGADTRELAFVLARVAVDAEGSRGVPAG